MTDIHAFPNIAAMGLIKEVMLNKKIYANLMKSLEQISDEEMQRIDSELPNAKHILHNVIITPTAVIQVSGLKKVKPISNIILNRDIIYIWGAVQTMRMNFIPYQKMHTINILARTGNSITIGPVSTGGFSRKDITGNCINELKQILEQDYPGILYGWTKERENAMMKDIGLLAQAVDQARGA